MQGEPRRLPDGLGTGEVTCMCGIAGMIELTGRRAAPPDVVPRMARAIIHRGPDEDGFLEEPGLHLANRRLSIVGLADGRQPISNENQDVWTVFNGEFFEYPEKRAELEAKGHRFRTHTDTELIPHLWEEYKLGCLEHLRGQFAFCVWDKRSNEILLARDRAGICPLFYTTIRHDGSDWLLFCSEMKGLFASGLVPRAPDHRGINGIFSFMAMPGPITVFEGIHCLVPGRYLHFKLGQTSPAEAMKQKTYWEITYPDEGQEEYGSDEKRVVDDFERVLYTSVQRRLRADVPVVSYLSGGVDSSLVVAMASKALGRPIPTYTISVKGEGLDESHEALATAKHLGCHPVVVNCAPDEIRTGYPELIGAAEFPVIDTSCLGLLDLAKAVHKNGFKVALTGEGADEWLAGYSWHKINRIVKYIPFATSLRRSILRLTGQPRYPKASVRETQRLLGGHNGWMDMYGIISLNKLRFFGGALRESMLGRSAYSDLELTPNLHRWHPFHRELYLGARIHLPGHLLASKGDRIAMHSSVETRYVFLDEDVVAFMAKLHPRWKLRGLLRDKFIERRVAERWLPKEVAWRRKFMFRAPLDTFAAQDANLGAKKESEAWIDQVLSPESLRKTGYFDADAVTSARLKLPAMKRGLARTSVELGLTAVTATQLWHHLYISGDLAEISSRVPDLGSRVSA